VKRREGSDPVVEHELGRVEESLEVQVRHRSRAAPPNVVADPRAGDGAVPPAFSVDVRPERDVVRVCPIGEVDLDTVDIVRAQLNELRVAGFTCVVLDLREVTFLDSSVLHLAIEAQTASSADGWAFGIIEGPANVQRAFEVAGLRDRLPFVDPAELSRLRRTNAR
jgi:anti-sigma B factor antagonist